LISKRHSVVATVGALSLLVIYAGLPGGVGTALAQEARPLPEHAVELPLWPGTPPAGGEGVAGLERDITTPRDERIGGRAIIRLTGVSVPLLTYFPPKQNPLGADSVTRLHPVLVVFPGGGYTVLAYDLEGREICEWATGLGMACVLVKYRVPSSGPYPKVAAALEDAQRALAVVHAHASQWNLDSTRIGVAGFSAGAHLAVTLAGTSDLVYPQVDGKTATVFKPAFVMLLYPAYLTLESDDFKLKANLTPGPGSPPTFLVQAEDDPVHVGNALAYAAALAVQGVPAELHIFAHGGHGYGLRETLDPVTHWTGLAETWLHTVGVLPAGK
jgi:acetyl esterase/lipase